MLDYTERSKYSAGTVRKNANAVALGKRKKTVTPQAIQQRIEAVKSRWRKYRARNRKKRKGISARNLALLVTAATMIGSAVLIWIGETNPQGYAVKLPGGIEIHP